MAALPPVPGLAEPEPVRALRALPSRDDLFYLGGPQVAPSACLKVFHVRNDRRAHLRHDCELTDHPRGSYVPMSCTRDIQRCRACGPRSANGWALGRIVHVRMVEMGWDPAVGYLPAPFYRDDYQGPVGHLL